METPKFIIMQVYLSGGELQEVKRITAKHWKEVTEREFEFIIAMAARTTRMPIVPKPPFSKALIKHNGIQFKIIQVERNEHLSN
ncbi:MAG: hypothetical protein A2066_14940 [Bacteroidetes bacterium GWB2_41_8]|nr:MAG: hypothetical protein A2066_14940 [Bacteroidetes bacterium GWB2_41_8]